MKYFVSLLLLLSFLGCQFFDKKVPNEDALFKEKLKAINWNEVTDYPSISACDSITDKEQRKSCFFYNFKQIISDKLTATTTKNPIIDSISLRITIFSDGNISFNSEETDSLQNATLIDSIISEKLINLPKITPAQKEGIPVKTEFLLKVPVILKN